MPPDETAAFSVIEKSLCGREKELVNSGPSSPTLIKTGAATVLLHQTVPWI